MIAARNCRSEANGITLKSCPAYISERIMSQKSTLAKPVRVPEIIATNRKIGGRKEKVRNIYGHKLGSGSPVARHRHH